MNIFAELNNSQVAEILNRGGLGVIPTDTLYGIVASANSETAIDRLYKVRNRDLGKACIVLVGDKKQIFDVDFLNESAQKIIAENWPGPVSIILPAARAPEYLHRGQLTLAYRLPAKKELQELLLKTGPLIAPSANLAGHPPASSLAEAEAYFGSLVDFYVDGGDLSNNKPSKLISIKNGQTEVLRG